MYCFTVSSVCDLNPIKVFCGKIKRYVKEHNCCRNLSLYKLEDLTKKLQNATVNDWDVYDIYCKRVGQIEERYCENYSIVSNVTYNTIIKSLGL